MIVQGDRFTLRPVRDDERASVLEVYRLCEDFLELTPQPTASMEMVQDDLELSRQNGGVFCGIFDAAGVMMGILDVVLKGFEGDPETAFIELLMIGQPYRDSGLGSAVVEAVEAEIMWDAAIKVIASAVMVNNLPAIRFWTKRGYTIAGGAQDQPDGTTVWKLRKPIMTRSQ